MAERPGPDRWLFDLWSRFTDAPWVQRLIYGAEAAGFRVEEQRTIFRLPAPLILPCVLTVASRPG